MCQRWTIAIGTETLDDIWEIMNHETSTSLPYHDMVELRQQQGTILRRDHYSGRRFYFCRIAGPGRNQYLKNT